MCGHIFLRLSPDLSLSFFLPSFSHRRSFSPTKWLQGPFGTLKARLDQEKNGKKKREESDNLYWVICRELMGGGNLSIFHLTEKAINILYLYLLVLQVSWSTFPPLSVTLSICPSEQGKYKLGTLLQTAAMAN